MSCTSMFGLVGILLMAATITVRASSPEKCCLPVKFEGKLHSIRAQVVTMQHPHRHVHVFMNGTLHGDFSHSVNRVAFVADVKAREKMHIRFIDDLDTNIMNIIVDDFCIQRPMPIPIRNNCFLEHATYNGREKLGGVGDDGLEVDIWNINQGMTFLEMHFVKDTCIPVFQAVKHSSFGTEMAQGSLFTEPKFEVSDPSVFDIPESCHVKDFEKEKAYMDKLFGPTSGALPVKVAGTIWLVLGSLFLSSITA